MSRANLTRMMVALMTLVMMTGAGAVTATAEEIQLSGASYGTAPAAREPGLMAINAGGDEVYRIGPSDVLDITVWQSPDLNRTVTVRFDGRITLPLSGELVAAGLTPLELAAEIGERLREFIRSPQVSVTVKEFQSRQVLVLGKIGRPGIYPLRGPMKVLELLTAAGIDLAAVDLKNIGIIRATGETFKIDLEALLYRQDVGQNIELRAGDNVFVPEKVVQSEKNGPGGIVVAKEIMVLGEVNKPGAFSFPADRTVTVKEVLLQAGGASAMASLSNAKVIRLDKIQEPTDLNKLIFNGDMAQDLQLYSGDVLYVPRRKQMRVYCLGMVNKPGVYEGQPNTLDLMQVLSLAVPSKFGAVLSNVKVVRGWPNSPKVLSANVEALLYKGRLEENIPLQEGDVIYVPESFLSNTIEVVTRILAPLTGSVTFIESVQDMQDNKNNN